MRQSHSLKWQAPDGSFRYVVHWPTDEPRTQDAILIVHGHGEHIGRYQRFVDSLCDLPVDFLGYDHAGHGRSDGKRGDAAGIDALASDLLAILPFVREQSGCTRLVVFGHSMGGLILARMLTRDPGTGDLAGAIISDSAFLVPKTPVTRIKIALGRVVARFAPTALFHTGLDASAISRDPETVRAYKSDPLVHDFISARFGKSMIDDGEICAGEGSRCKVPLLIYHGTGDRIASIEGTRRFVRDIPPHLVEYHELPGVYHEPHNEPARDAEKVFGLIRDWIRSKYAGLNDRGRASVRA